MRIFNRLILSAAAMTAALSITAASAQDVVRLGKSRVAPIRPSSNVVNAAGELEGFDVDIAKALCLEAELNCEFVFPLDWDGIIPGLLAGNYDAIIASMSITEERKKQVDFTNKYYNTPPAIAVPKGFVHC